MYLQNKQTKNTRLKLDSFITKWISEALQFSQLNL